MRPVTRDARPARSSRPRPWALAPLLALVLTACGSGGGDGTDGAAADTPAGPTGGTADGTAAPGSGGQDDGPGGGRPGSPETVATGLDAPWGLGFLPDGSALLTERDTALVKRVDPDGTVTTVGEVPGVNARGEGGLLGLAVSPDFAQDQRLFLYFTSSTDNRIVRTTYDGQALGPVEPLVTDIPISGIHNGGRLAFGPDGHLYAGTGDASETGLAQELDSLGGKVLRMTTDGEAPEDNPFPGSLVFTLGHRNVQGLAFDGDGRLWASEFGQDRVDEVNLLEAGGNYGWPQVEGAGGRPEYVDPLVEWAPAEASPSGGAVVGDTFWVAALRGQRLWEVPLQGETVGEPRDHLVEELGRLRLVTEAPDGALWLLTNNTDGRGDPREGDDRVVRVPLDG